MEKINCETFIKRCYNKINYIEQKDLKVSNI